MATTENNYTGNGSKTDYSITFQYLDDDDIKVSLDGVLTTAYTLSNATTVLFSSAPANGVLIRIYRDTNVDSLKSTFFAGSSIRAQDLNKNFEQNNYAVQEIQNYTWDNETDTIHSDETWASSDTQIATTAAMDARFWDQDTDTIDSTETWQDSDSYIPTAGAVDSAIDEAITNDIATDGTGITVTDDGDGTITLGLAANTIDLDRIKDEDIVTYAEQNAGSPSWDSDSRIPTTYASSRRHDCLVQTSTPAGSDWQVGKMWVQNDSDRTVHIWDGTQWLPIASGGAFTTLPKVVYVDSINGDDSYEAHRLSNPKKTIKSAIDDINADPSGDGSIVVVAPGVYGETFPIDIQKNDVAIVGTSLRNVIIHPAIPAADQAGYDVDVPEANELQTMFRVNSGSYFYGLTLQGMKASGTRGGNTLDTDATYGLPTNQGWNFAFYPGATIRKSPYIQNCTNFSDSQINNVNFTPHTPGEGSAGDLDSNPSGGGILVDGSVPDSASPLRSMVCDSYTHTALDGPGIFVTNNGYCQATSSYAFFCHYHIKTKNGGQANLAASTTDFGRYSIIADGRSTNAIFTAATTAGASTNDTTFTIGAPTVGPDWHGSATRPQDNMLVDIGGYTYPVLSAVAAGSGWTVTISRPDPANLSQNLGLQNNVASGASANFYLRSMVASSGHTMEYVGSGTNYTALPENGGVPVEASQRVELNNGKIWAAITDHKGKFIVGDTFSVDQQTGFIETGSGSFAIPRLIVDLDLNGNNISDSTGNVVINDTLSMNSNKIVNVTDPTSAQDAATKAYVDALETSLEGGQLDNLYFRQDTGETIESGDTWSSSDLSIATTAAIDARIVDLVDDVGGFVPINDENSFPATNPDINDGAGTLISIQEISTSRTPSGGTVTIANGSGSNTVTINNCGTTVLAAGYGCIVETTTTLHTYNFHRLTPLATEVSTVAANVTPINTVATNISDVTTVSTDIASVVTVANDLNEPVSEIDTVATNITNVNNVGNNITDVTTVSGSISNVNTVASDITNVNNTGTYIANVNTVAGQISPTNNVATVAGVASDIPTVAGISSNVTTVAGISSNVTTVAGISGNVTTVAGISSDVTAVANNNTDVSTVATNITDVNTFANRYRIASSDPTTSLDTGDLVFNTTSNELRVYNGTAWQGGVTATGNLVSKSGDTMTGDLSFGGSYKATNLATPTATGDAATKGYVDTAVSGIATDIDGLSDGTTQYTDNVGLGTNALSSLASGSSQNTALGYSAGQSITTRLYNTFIGGYAGQYVNQSRNTVIGAYAMQGTSGATTCVRNVAIGDQALQSVTTGNDSVVIGSSAGKSLTTGNKSVIIGSSAGYSLTVGTDNVYLGNSTGLYQTNSYNIGIGTQALNGVSGSSTGGHNTAIGSFAGYSVTSGSDNLFIGNHAGYTATTANQNVYIGRYSGRYPTGNNNTAVGWYSLRGASAGSSAANNTCFGHYAGAVITSGANNTCVGYQAGSTITSGINNILLGSGADVSSATVSNEITLGNTSITKFRIPGINFVLKDNGGTPTVGQVLTADASGEGYWAAGGATSIDGLSDAISQSSSGQSIGLGSLCLTNDDGTLNRNTALGYLAGQYITSGADNVAIGHSALDANTTGARNTATGYSALGTNIVGGFNCAYGFQALNGCTNSFNTAVGYQAGNSITSGSNNLILGYDADASSSTVSNEITLGNTSITKFRIPGIDFVLKDNGGTPTTGQVLTADASGEGYWADGGATSIDGLSDGKVSGQNYGLGGGSIFSLTSGSNNVGYGYRAIYSITSGSNNTGIGNEALEFTSTASHNTALGHFALTNSNADGNTAVGYTALQTNTSGYYNTAVGYSTMYANTTGVRNTALGIGALYANTTGGYNTAVGDSAGYGITTGQYNVCLGYQTYAGTSSQYNVMIGSNAGSSTATGSYNTGIGYEALNVLTTGTYNVCLGYRSGDNISTGTKNISIGRIACSVTEGAENVFIGDSCGSGATTNSSRNTYVGAGVKNGIGNGDENSCFGYQAGQDLTTGNNNAFFGKWAGWNVTSGRWNTIVGSQAGDALTSGDGNIVIGFNASASSATVDNEATIGSYSINKFRVPGVDFVVEGHAWVNFQGTGTVSIRDSNNVSSVTDNGTGDYTVSFTNSFPNASYAWALNARNDDNNASSQSFVGVTANCETPSTSSFRMSAVTPVNNTKQDHKYIVGQFFH